jgi:hypothetical protein
MNIEEMAFREKEVRRRLLFSTPRLGIPGEHRVN